MSRLSIDPEMDDLERRRSFLLRKDRKEEMRKEILDLERKHGGKEPRRPAPDMEKIWAKRGILVTDMRRPK